MLTPIFAPARLAAMMCNSHTGMAALFTTTAMACPSSAASRCSRNPWPRWRYRFLMHDLGFVPCLRHCGAGGHEANHYCDKCLFHGGLPKFTYFSWFCSVGRTPPSRDGVKTGARRLGGGQAGWNQPGSPAKKSWPRRTSGAPPAHAKVDGSARRGAVAGRLAAGAKDGGEYISATHRQEDLGCVGSR